MLHMMVDFYIIFVDTALSGLARITGYGIFRILNIYRANIKLSSTLFTCD